MLGLYLAIIAIWMFSVLVFVNQRHMRVIIFVPIVILIGLPLMLFHKLFKFLEEYWGGFWIYIVDVTDEYLGENK